MTKNKNAKPNAQQAKVRLKGASPISGVVPPVEHRFKPGVSGNPNGAPRKLADLKELIVSTLAEEMHTTDPATGKKIIITRAQAMIRTMLIKTPSDRIALLEYAFGKVPTTTHEMNDSDWREWLKQNGYTDNDIDSLVSEFAAHMGSKRDSASSPNEAASHDSTKAENS